MKRSVYLFIIIISIFAIAFLCRELVMLNGSRNNDDIKRIHQDISYVNGSSQKLQTMEADYCDLYGGLVVDPEAGFYHRYFYVRVYNGQVTIFNMYGSICRETGVPIEAVKIKYRKVISRGVYFESISDAEEFVDRIK